MARNNSMNCSCGNPSIKTRFITRPYCKDCDDQLKANFRDTELDFETVYDSIVEACCKQYCEVEPDGYCEHKCPSVLIRHGVI